MQRHVPPHPYTALHVLVFQAATHFVNFDGECLLEARGTRLCGKLGGNYTVPTSVELSDAPAAIEVVLMKQKQRGGASRLASSETCQDEEAIKT